MLRGVASVLALYVIATVLWFAFAHLLFSTVRSGRNQKHAEWSRTISKSFVGLFSVGVAFSATLSLREAVTQWRDPDALAILLPFLWIAACLLFGASLIIVQLTLFIRFKPDNLGDLRRVSVLNILYDIPAVLYTLLCRVQKRN